MAQSNPVSKGADIVQVARSQIFYKWVYTDMHMLLHRGDRFSPFMFMVIIFQHLLFSKVDALLFRSTYYCRRLANLYL